jgi:hypothetical protein
MAAWKGVKWNLIKEDDNFSTMDISRVDWTDITMNKIENNSNEYAIKLTFSKEDYSGNLVQKTCSIIAGPTDLSRKQLQAKNDEFADFSRFPKCGGGLNAIFKIKVFAALCAMAGSEDEPDLRWWRGFDAIEGSAPRSPICRNVCPCDREDGHGEHSQQRKAGTLAP